MVGLDELADLANIRRAWRWVRSNPDAQYKSYFRDLYSAYAIADERLLAELQEPLRQGTYQASHACKLFLPKPSGILRPYSLLSVQDQVAYQAAVNVVAERLFPRVRSLYYKDVFGHLYAGKTSACFYRTWSDGYAKFNEAARQAFAKGFRFAASFDLTACYDSLDHGVLQYFLERIGCEREFCQLLASWLNVWTATDKRIYHNHGVPEGPISSGLLSEAVLRHFDAGRGRQQTVRYLRYVDDIRLFAKDEKTLRQMLFRLDLLSKDIGLFPQSSKIGIGEIKDIEEELKSVSRPTEATVRAKRVDQKRLRRRIVQLSPRFDVKNSTRFKYLLAYARPESSLTRRLWRIYEKAPQYYDNIARYLRRYRTMPDGAATRLLAEIRKEPLYQAIAAAFISAADGRLSPPRAATADFTARKMWKPATLQADLLVALGRRLLSRGKLTFDQTRYVCLRAKSWWARSQLALCLVDRFIGRPSFEWLVNHLLRDGSSDVARAAAFVAVSGNVKIVGRSRTIHRDAAAVLREFGLIRRMPAGPCRIRMSFTRMFGRVRDVQWRTVFGRDYREAERQAILCRAYADTNATAWVNAVDVFNDWLLMSLYGHDPSLGTYVPGSVGSVMGSRRLRSKYPAIQAMVRSIHEKRRESALSHAKEKRTGRPTRAVRFSYIRKAKPLIRAAISELAVKW